MWVQAMCTITLHGTCVSILPSSHTWPGCVACKYPVAPQSLVLVNWCLHTLVVMNACAGVTIRQSGFKVYASHCRSLIVATNIIVVWNCVARTHEHINTTNTLIRISCLSRALRQLRWRSKHADGKQR